ncbi:vacuolar iron transporter homolog 4-like isoform X2 [Quercus robur]|uniref:vacuolar iron transporter homolog 4-like isoform X2 n=1 Tax=Quercus robur TaxID=38942 RepID=UPI0021626B23|nr:vacuolar iron transporter homolog 4-like isoform X2 [Quercus robur]
MAAHQAQDLDHTKRGQWLRTTILGYSDALLYFPSYMILIGAVLKDKTAIFSGVSWLVAGACSMAIGEFISACSKYYIDNAQMKRECSIENMGVEELDAEKEKLSNPWHGLSIDTAFSFLVGACVWLLLGVQFVKNCVRVGLIIAVVSFALLLFGGLGSIPAGTAVKSSLRVLLGGLVAMGVSYGFTKLLDSAGL